jgi:hypothetical protein
MIGERTPQCRRRRLDARFGIELDHDLKAVADIFSRRAPHRSIQIESPGTLIFDERLLEARAPELDLHGDRARLTPCRSEERLQMDHGHADERVNPEKLDRGSKRRHAAAS